MAPSLPRACSLARPDPWRELMSPALFYFMILTYYLLFIVFRSGFITAHLISHKQRERERCTHTRTHTHPHTHTHMQNRCFSGGVDRAVKTYDFTSSTDTVLGEHEKAVKAVCWQKDMGCCVSGSWDSTLKVWDVRQGGKCVATSALPDKVFTMSTTNNRIVVGTANRHVWVFDFRNLSDPEQKRESALKFQTRQLRSIHTRTHTHTAVKCSPHTQHTHTHTHIVVKCSPHTQHKHTHTQTHTHTHTHCG